MASTQVAMSLVEPATLYGNARAIDPGMRSADAHPEQQPMSRVGG